MEILSKINSSLHLSNYTNNFNRRSESLNTKSWSFERNFFLVIIILFTSFPFKTIVTKLITEIKFQYLERKSKLIKLTRHFERNETNFEINNFAVILLIKSSKQINLIILHCSQQQNNLKYEIWRTLQASFNFYNSPSPLPTNGRWRRFVTNTRCPYNSWSPFSVVGCNDSMQQLIWFNKIWGCDHVKMGAC